MRTIAHSLASWLGVAALVIALSGCKRSGVADDPAVPPDRVTVGTLLTEGRPASDDAVTYTPPSLQERLQLDVAAEQVLQRVMGGRRVRTIALRAFHDSGLHAEKLDNDFLVLRERDRWRGTGIYVFRIGNASDLVLQAPHGFHDRHTAEIGWAAFRQSSARAFFLNTAHRYRADRSYHDGIERADLAHTTDSYFYLMSEHVIDARPDVVVLQLHGFDDKRLARQSIDLVLSDGTDQTTESLQRWRDRFANVLEVERIAIYPDDTRFLGATANTIGRLIRLKRRGEFLHVEMSRELRERVLDDPQLVADVLDEP